MGYYLQPTIAPAREPDPVPVDNFGETAKNAVPQFFTVESGYRFYSPELGRWLNRDPIGEAGGGNPYSVQNDLVGHQDVLGLYVSIEGTPVDIQWTMLDHAKWGLKQPPVAKVFAFTVPDTVPPQVFIYEAKGCDCVFGIKQINVKYLIHNPSDGNPLWVKTWLDSHEREHVRVGNAILANLAESFSSEKRCRFYQMAVNNNFPGGSSYPIQVPRQVDDAFCLKAAKKLSLQIAYKIDEELRSRRWSRVLDSSETAAPWVITASGAPRPTKATASDLKAAGDAEITNVNSKFTPWDWDCPYMP